MSEQVLLEERDGAVLTLTMNRPKTKNALDPALIEAITVAFARANEDAGVRVVVLTGAGGSFCSGADLKKAIAENPDALADVNGAIERVHGIIKGVVHTLKPVIALVDGPAVGFGCDLALACDMRIASPEAYFQEKFVKIGLMPDGGGTFWLPRLVGLSRAMEMMMFGDAVKADRALEWGLVNRVVPAADIKEETMRLARHLAMGPPIAFAEMKRAVRYGVAASVDQALDIERAGQIRCLKSGDCMEGILAWMQKRPPQFQGR